MPRRSLEYLLVLALLSVVFVFFNRGPSNVSEQIIPSSNNNSNAGGMSVVVNGGAAAADAGPTNPIRQISVLGERNSGTRWTFE